MMSAQNLPYFQMLTHQEQRAAIQRMSAGGMSDYIIAAATALSVEMIRRVLAELREAATP
jgi:hypothetical protein